MSGDILVQTTEYRVEGLQSPEKVQQIMQSLARIQGVEGWTIEPPRLRVNYCPQLISPALIRGEIEKVGRLVDSGTNRPGFLSRFINRLAASNERTFGSSTLDCCSLNRKKTPD